MTETQDRPARRGGEPEPVDIPSRTDRFVGGLSQAIGGPLGAHAARQPGRLRAHFWTAARVVLALTCLTLALHWVQKSPCQDAAWSDLEQFTKLCYTDVVALYGAEDLDVGAVPYLDYPVEYPVLTGAMMGLIGLPVHAYGDGRPEVNQYLWFYNLTALALFAGAVAAAAMMLALRRRRPWDVAMFALAPALFVTATVNWDLLAVALAVGGILAWARNRPTAAGILLGLGAAAKLWPAFLLLPLLFLALRTARWEPVKRAVTAAALAWLAVNVPVMVANFDNWLEFLRRNTERAVDWGTFWYVGREFEGVWRSGEAGERGPFQWLAAHVDPQLNWLSYLLFGLACAGVGVLTLRAPRRPRFAALAFLVVAAFLLFAKVWSQQFVLWLLPLAVLARPRWGAFLAWQAAELGYFLAFYGKMLNVSGQPVIPEGVFVLAAALRWSAVVLLCGFVVNDILRPAGDAVRRNYADDPDGGPYDGAPDAGGWAERLAPLGLRPGTARPTG
jgi:uncharacterized membrane protein